LDASSTPKALRTSRLFRLGPLAVLKERRPAETRVAATPETVKKYKVLGLDVAVEAGSGVSSGIPDAAFAEAGAMIAPDAAAALDGAGIVLIDPALFVLNWGRKELARRA
jgi:hypothetical protein